jgi:hypothetical protein
MAEAVGLPPISRFRDNMRPAGLLLHVFQLLECGDEVLTEGELLEQLRELVAAPTAEDLMVLRNEIFLGLVREGANLPRANLRTASLTHLLRQAIVASCTALDAFLPAMLRTHMPLVIQAKGRRFWPDDEQLQDYFSELTFTVPDVLRLLEAPKEAPLYLSNRIVGEAKFKYLSNKKGIHVVGALLGLDRPWHLIGEHLGREQKALIEVVEETVGRRNDIVHRADRGLSDPDGDQRPITYIQAKQGVDTIEHVSEALHELVELKMAEHRRQLAEVAS